MRFVQRKAEWERREIQKALSVCKTVTEAAQMLEVGRTNLYHRIRVLGIPRPSQRADWARHGL